MKILIVGGAGYIGSHMVRMLLDREHDVITLDNLVSGHRDAVRGGKFIHGDIADVELLNRLFTEHQFDGVMHFASHIQVSESIRDPAKYYRNNVANTQNLLDSMVLHGVRRFIFSSTAAIFGEPHYIPIDEAHPKIPINAYGHSKLMVEQMLADYDQAYGLRTVCLRYFNAAGAHPDSLLGERHDPETHLIPLILQAASGRRETISVFGRDYPTADGTCIRDYIHVTDLCQAHLLALEQLMRGEPSAAYNLGNGNGISVQQVIDVARKITGREIKVIDATRRDGDPAILVADSVLAKTKLHWSPCHAKIESIIQHAWNWECKKTGRQKIENISEWSNYSVQAEKLPAKESILECAGYCSTCNQNVSFVANNSWLRDHFLCTKCGSIPRERALMHVIEQFYPNWRNLTIHETSPGNRGASVRLAQECKTYTPTQFFPSQKLGAVYNGLRCENLESLTFGDECIDLHISQDVMEHIFRPEKAFQEIARTLKPGGAHIFTVPLVNKMQASKLRARIAGDSDSIEFLEQPVYHGNPIDSQGSLVTMDWGYDIVRYIFDATGLFTHTLYIDDLSKGIRAEYIEVLVTLKPRTT